MSPSNQLATVQIPALMARRLGKVEIEADSVLASIPMFGAQWWHEEAGNDADGQLESWICDG